jgi:hypothetical protein
MSHDEVEVGLYLQTGPLGAKMCQTIPAVGDGELEIQKMLGRHLQRRVAELEKERDSLVAALHLLAIETVARVFVLEEDRDSALALRRAAEESLATLESELAVAREEIRRLRARLRGTES